MNVYQVAPLEPSTWRRMKEVRRACMLAGVAEPSEVTRFFDEHAESSVPLLRSVYPLTATAPECDVLEHGVYIDLRALPEAVTHLLISKDEL